MSVTPPGFNSFEVDEPAGRPFLDSLETAIEIGPTDDSPDAFQVVYQSGRDPRWFLIVEQDERLRILIDDVEFHLADEAPLRRWMAEIIAAHPDSRRSHD